MTFLCLDGLPLLELVIQCIGPLACNLSFSHVLVILAPHCTEVPFHSVNPGTSACLSEYPWPHHPSDIHRGSLEAKDGDETPCSIPFVRDLQRRKQKCGT